MVMRRIALLLVLLTSWLGAAELQVQYLGAVLPGQQLQLKIVLEGASSQAQELHLPAANGVTWLRQRQVLNGSSNFNGDISFRAAWLVVAELDERTRWELPGFAVSLKDGSRIESEREVLTETAIDHRLSGDFYCAVSFEPAIVVPGQATDVVYDIFLRQAEGVELEGGLGVKLPDGAITLGTSRATSQEMVFDTMGDPWVRNEVRWTITMTEAGSYQIGGQQGFTQLKRVSGGRLRRVAVTVPVHPGTLTVTTLPTEGQPDDFGGLIGPVTIEASLERDAIALGEGTTYSVTVRGRQLELLGKLPAPTVPGLRVRAVDDAEGDDGSHRFDFNLQPEQVGRFAIAPPSLSYFDPEAGRYRRAEGPILHLEVLPGRQRDLAIGGMRRPESDDDDEQRVAPGFPPPLRGGGWARLALGWGWMMLALGALAGVAIGLGQRLIGRIATAPKPGAQLRQAIAAGDLSAIDRRLHQALATAPPPLQPRLGSAIAAVERARFGGGELDAALRAELDALTEALGG